MEGLCHQRFVPSIAYSMGWRSVDWETWQSSSTCSFEQVKSHRQWRISDQFHRRLYWILCKCVCEWESLLPNGFALFWLQIRHCAFVTGWPGTCSTSLQNISGPDRPHVALLVISAMEARFKTAGNKPGIKKKEKITVHTTSAESWRVLKTKH